MASKPLVSIVVLNWNGLQDTKTCLKSLRKLDYPDYEIIVVDNGSTDGSKDYLASQEDLIFIDLPSNTGFTGGHIAGFDKSQGEYIALINNDCVAAPNWLTELVAVFEKHPDAAAAGGKSFMWNKDYPAYDQDNPFYSYQEVDTNQAYTRTMMTGESTQLVDAISGAALMVHKPKLKDTGYLDNDFFAYYEETDLLARLKRKGFNVYFCPGAHIWHKIAASSEGGAEGGFYLKQMHRNRFYYAYKNFDPVNLRRFLNHYSKEVMNARLRNLRRGGGDIEAKSRIAANKEARKNLASLKTKRREILKLGKTYNDTLGQHQPADVTIIIPCYNYGEHVGEAIESALRQSHKPTRIIVINDGSTDNSLGVINKYKNNPLVDVFDKKNEGVIATKNLGIKLAKTYWTMFLDADDIIDEDTLKIMLRSVRLDGMTDVLYSDMRLFGSISDVFKAKPFHPHSFLSQNYINNTTLINTTYLKRSGGYKTEMSEGLEDMELYVTLFEHGARFRYIPQPLVWYRQHNTGQMSRNTEVQDITLGRRLYGVIKSLHPALYKKYGWRQKLNRMFIKAIYIPIKHPGVFAVVLRSIPGAGRQAARHILHNVRLYLLNKG